MTRKKHESEEVNRVIAAMYADGETTEAISKAVGINRAAVTRRISIIGLSGKLSQWTPERDDVIRRYINLETRDQIAARLDTTVGAVAGRVKRLGLVGQSPAAPMAWTDDEDDFLRENVSSMTQADMARELSRDPSSVSRRLDKLGIKPVTATPTVFVKPQTKKKIQIAPLTARPWLTRTNSECRYLFGDRHAYMACCQPTWEGTVYCEDHAALCGGYKRVAA